MAKRVLIDSSRKSAEVSFELPDVVGVPFTVTGQFFRIQRVEGEKMEKPEKGTIPDPNHPATRIFNVFKLEGHDDQVYPIEIAKLNGCKSWSDVKETATVKGIETFTIKENAVITIQDGVLSFGIKG